MWWLYILSFFGGCLFGVIFMALMVAASRDDKGEEMDIEMKETINQLKSRLEQFEGKDESYQECVVRGMFFSITAMQQGIQYADKKVSLRKMDKVSIERSKQVAAPPDCGCERC